MFKFTLSKRVQSLVGSEDRSFSLQTYPLKWRTQTPSEYTLSFFSQLTLWVFFSSLPRNTKPLLSSPDPSFSLSPSFFRSRTYHPILLRNQKGYGSMGLQTHQTHPRTSLHNRLNRRPPRETPVKTPLRTYQKKTTWSITVNIPW